MKDQPFSVGQLVCSFTDPTVVGWVTLVRPYHVRVIWPSKSAVREVSLPFVAVRPLTIRETDAVERRARARGWRFVVEGTIGDERVGQHPDPLYPPWFVRREVPDDSDPLCWRIDDMWSDGGVSKPIEDYSAAVRVLALCEARSL